MVTPVVSLASQTIFSTSRTTKDVSMSGARTLHKQLRADEMQ